MDGASVTALLADLLFKPDSVSRERFARADARAVAAVAEHEQVLPLVLREVRRRGWESAALQEGIRRWALHEALERDAVRDVLDRAGAMRALFFKGAALAFTMYADSRDRMRVDWDVLVSGRDFDALERALLACGFEKDVKTPRGIRNRQQSFRRALTSGECTIDVHTGIVNAPALSERIRFDDLWGRSVPIPALHPSARAAGDADALLIACLHRLVHHSGEQRLVWDADIRQLTHRLDDAAVLSLVATAAEWQAGPLAAAEISRVAARSDAAAPGWVPALASQPSDLTSLARANRSRGDDFLIDWRGLGWRGRAAIVRETLFPDPAYLRESSGSTLPLPLLYLRRIVRGAAAWLRRPRTNRPT